MEIRIPVTGGHWIDTGQLQACHPAVKRRRVTPPRWLLARMLLRDSRQATRTTPDSDLVLLADQDCDRWDRRLITEGQTLVRRCLRLGQPGPYQTQATINPVPSDALPA
jgi:uncharacterized protein DUF6596